MSPLEQQIEALKVDQPSAQDTKLPDGACLISIPNFCLPAGWNKATTTLLFVAPVGYPHSKPDCFWTDADLRTADGRVPQNTGSNAIPSYPGSFLWFSWHTSIWSPNTDSLLTYLHVIERRLEDAK